MLRGHLLWANHLTASSPHDPLQAKTIPASTVVNSARYETGSVGRGECELLSAAPCRGLETTGVRAPTAATQAVMPRAKNSASP